MVEVVVKYCWIARTKQSVITLAALITPSSRLERKKYDVERYQPVIEQPDTEIPLMLSQAIIVAGVLAVGELACSPLYFSLLKASLALIPWAMEAVFMAVAFTFVVGFALLWCAESFTFKLKERFRRSVYAAVG